MLVTMEFDRGAGARGARRTSRAAGLADRVSVIVGDAQLMIAKVAGPFDLIFQDGDKQLYRPMLDRLVELLRPGGLLVTDNVLWDGEVVPGFTVDAETGPRSTRARSSSTTSASRRIPHLMTSIVPLRDGVAISVKRSLKADILVASGSWTRRPMTIESWLQAAIADAERRGLPELKPILEALARSTQTLRAADFNDDAAGSRQPQSGAPR